METVSNRKPLYIGIAIGLVVGLIVAVGLYFYTSSKADRKLSNERKSLNDSFDKKLEELRQYLIKDKEE